MFYFLTRPSGITVYVDQDVTNLDLFTLFGNPSRARTWTLIINTNVLVRSTNTANAAIYSSQNLPTGSLLKIINKGCIHGMGGNGASAGNPSHQADYLPTSGGNALVLPCKTYISTSSGYLFGGGGGGGGGFFAPYLSTIIGGGGGAGGGLAGALWGSPAATNGTTGILGLGGVGGTYTGITPNTYGGKGGNYGENGGRGTLWNSSSPATLGGLAGAAVKLNNFELTFLSGLDANHVKGSYTTN